MDMVSFTSLANMLNIQFKVNSKTILFSSNKCTLRYSKKDLLIWEILIKISNPMEKESSFMEMATNILANLKMDSSMAKARKSQKIINLLVNLKKEKR